MKDINGCELVVDKKEIARRFSECANSEEGQARIKVDSEEAKRFISDFKKAKEVSNELLNRRITI